MHEQWQHAVCTVKGVGGFRRVSTRVVAACGVTVKGEGAERGCCVHCEGGGCRRRSARAVAACGVHCEGGEG